MYSLFSISSDSTLDPGPIKTPSSDRLQDFDVYNIENTLPEVMDWTLLEQQLQQAAEEQQQRQVARGVCVIMMLCFD